MDLRFLAKYRELGLFVMRVVIGFVYAFHFGLAKISGGPPLWTKLGKAMGHLGIDFFPVFWGFMAASSEFGGGLLLIIGFFSRPASLLLCFTMAIATLSKWRSDGMDAAVFPFLMAVVFFGLALVGPGRWSVEKS